MTTFSQLVARLRNVPVRRFITALERDGFEQVSGTIGAHRIYQHPDGRTAEIAYHKGSATMPIKTLRTFLQRTQWNEDDARRLKLI